VKVALADVAANAIEPGRQALGLAQLRKAPPRLQQGLLHHVFGFVRSDPVQLCQPQQARASRLDYLINMMS
jgi:hypothetical protein